MKKKKAPKPRNPFTQHLVKKKQGAHGKTVKAQRKADSMSFKKNLKEGNIECL